VAAALRARYGNAAPTAAVRILLDNGAADRVTTTAPVRDALTAAREAGWASMIVTNGRVAQQTAKIRNSGLDEMVDGWVISEAIGVKKPSPEIFRAAAAVAGRALSGAWMIGDSAPADIGGAHALGLSSVWISLGRAWTEPTYHPTHVEPDAATAIRHVLGAAQADRTRPRG
jgi:putative hydrolase of the HAD superfamily